MDIGKDLTKRQQEIFEFIKKYSARYGYPPTVRDIGKAVGLASSSTVHAHLANLEKVGLLRRDPSLLPRESASMSHPQCAEEDSNLHPVIPDQALNLARLPIPPSARGQRRSIALRRELESVRGAR